jgi:glycerol-1-phosphate dehydrogenase [NAD(P)+]
MEDLCFNGAPVTHGHKVAIGTLAATAFTEIFFADPKCPPVPEKTFKRPNRDERRAEVSSAFNNSPAHDKVIAEAMEKMMDEQKANTINQAFMDTYQEIRNRVLEKLLPYVELKSLLARAECPVRPGDLGLSRDEVIATSRRAQMIRNKYCILDISWDMGNYNTILSKMEISDVYLR